MSDAATTAPQVQMVDGEGKPFTVDPGQVKEAEAQGWRTVTDPKELEALQAKDWGAQHPVLAGLAGLGRSTTLGLTDAIYTGAGGAPSTLKGLAEGSPLATMAGEVGGYLVPLAGELGAAGKLGRAGEVLDALAAPAGLVSKAGKAAEAAAGGGVLGGAARGAVEGGLYGAGSALSESVIEDKPLTGELLLAHTGPAAVFGAGISGTLEKALGLAAAKAPGALERVSGGLEKVAGKLEELGPGASVGRAEAALEAARPQVQKAVEEADAVRREVVSSLLGDAKAVPAASEVVPRLRQVAESLPEDTAARAALEKATERLEGRLSSASTAAEQVQALEKAVATIATRDTLSPAAGHLRAVLEDEGLWGKAGAVQREAFGRFDALRAAEAEAAPLMQKGGLKAAIQAAGEGEAGGVEAAKAWVQRAQELADHAHELSADLPTGRRNITQLGSIADQVKASTEKAVGDATPSLAEHAAELLPHGMAKVVQTIIAPTRQAEVIAHTMGMAAKTTGQIARLAKAALDGAKGSGAPVATVAGILSGHHYGTEPAKGESRTAAVARHAQDHTAIASLPVEQLAARLVEGTPELGRHAPGVAAAVQQTAVRAQKVLAAAAPKSARQPTGMPGEKTPPPSEVQLAHYERVARAVEQPLTVLEDLGRGRVCSAAVQALATAYPALYGEMCSQVTQALAQRTERVPYAQRLALSTFLQRPLDNSLKTIGALQANAAPVQRQPPQASGDLARPGAIKAGQRAATPLNRSPS